MVSFNLLVEIEGFVGFEIGGDGDCGIGFNKGIGFLIIEVFLIVGIKGNCICFFWLGSFGFIVGICFGGLYILFILKLLLYCGKV